MRVLPDVVKGRTARLLAVALAVGAAATALTGCAKFDAALGQQQAIVSFRDGTALAQKLTVRAACAKAPDVIAAPLPPDLNSSPYALEQVTYQIDKASDADVARLEECLTKYPSVEGVTLQDSADEGS
jgi:ABC-type phosphate transport system substrate-binding protein